MVDPQAPLFRELVLLPRVCSRASYATPTEERMCCMALAQCGPSTSIRDLRGGEWRRAAGAASAMDGPWRRLLELWHKCGVLTETPPARLPTTDDDASWLQEALASHVTFPLTAVVLPPNPALAAGDSPPRVAVDALPEQPWWRDGGHSALVPRTRNDLVEIFTLLLRQNAWCALVDPFLDPKRQNYRELGPILAEASARAGRARTELDLHVWNHVRGSSAGRQGERELPREEWESRFRTEWQVPFERAGIRAEVILWSDLAGAHDRFILTRRGGFLCGNGFDVPRTPARSMTVSCLSDSDFRRLWTMRDQTAHRDQVQTFRFGS